MYQNSIIFFAVMAGLSTVYCLILSLTDAGQMWNEARETRSVLTAIGVTGTLLGVWLYAPNASVAFVALAFAATGAPFGVRAAIRFTKRLRSQEIFNAWGANDATTKNTQHRLCSGEGEN